MVISAGVSKVIKRFVGNANDVITDEDRAFPGAIFRMFQTALPFEHRPAVKVVCGQFGENSVKFYLSIAQRSEPARTINPGLIAAIDTLFRSRIEFCILDMCELDTVFVGIHEPR